MKRFGVFVWLVLLIAIGACAPETPVTLEGGPDVLEGTRDFWRGYPALNPDGTVNAVIEIPAGTSAKWEVDKGRGDMRWEQEGDGYRIVRYLPYPANYGMIPQTLLPDQQGGDGDPLDVVVLSPALNRGTVIPVRLIGVLHLLDRGERDDKLLGVVPGTPLGEVEDLSELVRDFPGAAQIIETWFCSYKGAGEISSQGFGGADEAAAMLQQALSAYLEAYSPESVDSGGEAGKQGQDSRPEEGQDKPPGEQEHRPPQP